jgi:predicted AlkP superfamily pyrophosphatase or phosphodiesterase
VVVIVIDQFRPDYLKRFRPYFGPGGFNRFFRAGAVFTRSRYEHAITFTCPGHAVVLTGSYAEKNGIVSNEWYDHNAGRTEYCAEDDAVALLADTGQGRSPRNLIDSTVGDVLKRVSEGKSRVITISGKDRAAIMLGGHLADAAYWMRDTLVVTSTYYEKELPDWVRDFNASGAASSYLGKSWDRLLPAKSYAALGPDNVPAEQDVAGIGRTFPHRPVSDQSKKSLIEAFETSPFHNDVLVQFAMRAVLEENLGRDDVPDILGIGLSANDLIGHAFGPDSHEVMDVTVRTDRLLERLFQFLDREIGLANVTIVLTADHGVAPLPELVRKRDSSANAGRLDLSRVASAAEVVLAGKFGPAEAPGWIMRHEYPFLYLNEQELKRKQVPIEQAESIAKHGVEKVPGVKEALTATELERQRTQGTHSAAELSFYPGRSGNILYHLLPYWIPSAKPAGTTHGSPWPYDTEVPILWLGEGIRRGNYAERASVADIAPTLCALLGVPQSLGVQGRVLREILR